MGQVWQPHLITTSRSLNWLKLSVIKQRYRHTAIVPTLLTHFFNPFLHPMLQYGPDIFHWVHVRAVRRPRKNAIGKVFLEVTLNFFGGVFWIVILLEDPLVTQQSIGILVEVVVQDFAVQVAVKVLCKEMDTD